MARSKRPTAQERRLSERVTLLENEAAHWRKLSDQRYTELDDERVRNRSLHALVQQITAEANMANRLAADYAGRLVAAEVTNAGLRERLNGGVRAVSAPEAKQRVVAEGKSEENREEQPTAFVRRLR